MQVHNPTSRAVRMTHAYHWHTKKIIMKSNGSVILQPYHEKVDLLQASSRTVGVKFRINLSPYIFFFIFHLGLNFKFSYMLF